MTPWIQDWVDALESDYFKQGPTPANLWDPEGQYSALGVLCEITGCKREAVDLVSLRTNVKERMRELGNSSNVDIDSVVERIMQHRVMNDTNYHYTYNGKPREHENMSNIPISLAGKLDCNACLSMLNGVSRTIVIGIEGRQLESTVASLSQSLVPFAVIAEFIRDVWPALTFKQSKTFVVEYKDYGYFKLERSQNG